MNTLTEDQVKAFKTATKPVVDKWIPQIGTDVYEKAQKDMGQ